MMNRYGKDITFIVEEYNALISHKIAVRERSKKIFANNNRKLEELIQNTLRAPLIEAHQEEWNEIITVVDQAKTKLKKIKILRELKEFAEGITFLGTYYFDKDIKEVKEKYTKAIYEDLVNTHHYNFKLASELAKLTPMPIQNAMGQRFVAIAYGLIGPARSLTEHDFKLVAQYAGIPLNRFMKWCAAGETISNTSNGVLVSGATAVISIISGYILNAKIYLNEERVGQIVSGLGYIDTAAALVSYYYGKKYMRTIFGRIKPPTCFYYRMSSKHEKKVNAIESQNLHRS